jgi:hypothetical protein
VSNGLSFRFVSFEKEERVLKRRSSMNRKRKKSQTKNQKKKHEEERGTIYLDIENLLISLH